MFLFYLWAKYFSWNWATHWRNISPCSPFHEEPLTHNPSGMKPLKLSQYSAERHYCWASYNLMHFRLHLNRKKETSKRWFAFPRHTFDVRSNMTMLISQEKWTELIQSQKPPEGWGISLIIFRPIMRISAMRSNVAQYELLQFNSSRGGTGGEIIIKCFILFPLYLFSASTLQNWEGLGQLMRTERHASAAQFAQLRNPSGLLVTDFRQKYVGARLPSLWTLSNYKEICKISALFEGPFCFHPGRGERRV